MSDDVRISPIRPDFLDTVWPAVIAALSPAVGTAKGKFEIEDVRTDILDGTLVLWMVWRDNLPIAFFTTRIIQYPRRRAMALDWVGGKKMTSWMNLALDEVEAHARRNGCQHLEGYGRLAWGRVLKRRGWEPEYVAYRMELGDG